MNWRRGLLLAGIHLSVAVPMILILEARDAQSLRIRERSTVETEREAVARPPEQVQRMQEQPNLGETVTFSADPCEMTSHPPMPAVVEQAATYPTLILTGWRMDCVASWSLSARMKANVLWASTIKDERALDAARRKVDRAFLGVLVAQ